MRNLLVALWLVASVAACTPSTTGGNGSGSCSDSTECSAGEVCSSGSCRALCTSNSHCRSGTICSSSGICVPGSAPPVITSLDGTASLDPNAGPTDGAHRINDRLVIHGERLSNTVVTLVGTNPTTPTYTLEACEVGTDTQLTMGLPADLSTALASLDRGEFTLSVSNQAGQCTADLWLLRGEVGDLSIPLTLGAITVTTTGLDVAGGITATGAVAAGSVSTTGTVDASAFTVNGSPLQTGYWNESSGDVYYDAGHVGIGTDAPPANLSVRGSLSRQLTGIVSTTTGSATVLGSSTAFASELTPGDALLVGGETFTVASIADDVTLTLDAPVTVGVANAPAYSDSELLSVSDGNGVSKLSVDRSGRVRLDGGKGRMIRQINVQTDSTGRSYGTSWEPGATFAAIPGFKPGSLVLINYSVPMRNESTSWGGGYAELQVSFDGGTTWSSLGSSGYDTVMNYGGPSIGSYSNTVLVDPQQTSDFSVTVRFYHRSYDGTLQVNQSHNINATSGTATLMSGVNGSQHYTRVMVQELY